MRISMKESSEDAKKKKSRQRLGGWRGGLTLPAFVNAKSKPCFNPADVRKRREQFENAKKIKKYRKFVKRLPHQKQIASIKELSGVLHTEGKISPGSVGNVEAYQQRTASVIAKNERLVPAKGKNALEALRKDYMNKKQEVNRLQAERIEALKSKEEARSRAFQTRKHMKAKMFKRTESGQPIMKHRLQHILESIQQHE